MMDICRKHLINVELGDTAQLRPTAGAPQVLHLQRLEGEFLEWIRASYPEILVPKFSEPTVKHGVVLQIPMTGRPVFAKARRLPPDRLTTARAAFDDMSWAWVVCRSKSAWSSPLHMVPKEDGTCRPCGDFCCLIDATDTDKYPITHLQDFNLADAQWSATERELLAAYRAVLHFKHLLEGRKFTWSTGPSSTFRANSGPQRQAIPLWAPSWRILNGQWPSFDPPRRHTTTQPSHT